MKRYTFELIVDEGSDEFWETLAGKSGCDEVKEEISGALEEHGFVTGENCSLQLKKFTAE